LLVETEGTNGQGEPFGFGLSSGGDQVYLENALGEVLDHIEFGALAPDQAYARKPDGSTTFVIQTPTPGTSNNAIIANPIISDLSHNPTYPTELEVVNIEVQIETGDGTLTTAKIVWTVGGAAQADIELVSYGAAIFPPLYGATIPAQAVGAEVAYTIIAKNSAGGTAEKSGSYTVINAGINYTGLVINEVDGNGKFIELYNNSANSISLASVTLIKDEKTTYDKIWWTGGNVSIGAGSRYTIAQDDPDAATGANEYTGISGISPKKIVQFELKAPNGSVLNVFARLKEGMAFGDICTPDYGSTSPKYSFARCPDGTGAFGLAVPSCNAANPATAVGPIITE
jgi:hypothetical protein